MTQINAHSCDLCVRGPHDIDGHEALFTHSFSSSLVLFKCESCGAFWSRTYAGSGKFEWTRRDKPGTLHQWGGVSMPPRGHGS